MGPDSILEIVLYCFLVLASLIEAGTQLGLQTLFTKRRKTVPRPHILLACLLAFVGGSARVALFVMIGTGQQSILAVVVLRNTGWVLLLALKLVAVLQVTETIQIAEASQAELALRRVIRRKNRIRILTIVWLTLAFGVQIILGYQFAQTTIPSREKELLFWGYFARALTEFFSCCLFFSLAIAVRGAFVRNFEGFTRGGTNWRQRNTLLSLFLGLSFAARMIVTLIFLATSYTAASDPANEEITEVFSSNSWGQASWFIFLEVLPSYAVLLSFDAQRSQHSKMKNSRESALRRLGERLGHGPMTPRNEPLLDVNTIDDSQSTLSDYYPTSH